MKETIDRLEHLVEAGLRYLSQASEQELRWKSSPEKWSKKEILGHLIDSGIHNLQRFTEIQFKDKPYRIRAYNQDALVRANDYQHSETGEVLALWNSINCQIVHVMQNQTEESLKYAIALEEHSISDLRFLMVDYVDHLAHHLHQIMN